MNCTMYWVCAQIALLDTYGVKLNMPGMEPAQHCSNTYAEPGQF